jgi:hypothetical protein
VHLAVGDYDPAEIRHMIRTSGMGDYYGRYLDPEKAVAQMQTAPEGVAKVDKKAVAALHD